MCFTASLRSCSSSSSRPSTTSCTPVSAVVWDRQGLAEVYDGIDEKPVVLCRRQWYHSCNHSQGHRKEGGYDKPHKCIDDLFGQLCRNRANKANLVWICVRTSSSSSLTRSWFFFSLQRCTSASMRTSVCFSKISFFMYDQWQKPHGKVRRETVCKSSAEPGRTSHHMIICHAQWLLDEYSGVALGFILGLADAVEFLDACGLWRLP